MPDPAFVGTDTFEYAIFDGVKMDSARVSIEVVAEANQAVLKNLSSLAEAMTDYRSIHNTYPVTRHTPIEWYGDRRKDPSPESQTGVSDDYFDPQGRPYLSWRVHLLPFLGYQKLFNKFDLTQPWDSPTNLALIDQMPDLFGDRSGGQATETRIERITSPKRTPHPIYGEIGVRVDSPGRSPRYVLNGLSQTIMLIQTGPDKAVPWTAPQDAAFDFEDPIATLGTIDPAGIPAVTYAGATMILPADIDEFTFGNMVSRSHNTAPNSVPGFDDLPTVDIPTYLRAQAEESGGQEAVETFDRGGDRQDESLRRIGHAMERYHSAYKNFPPNNAAAQRDENGRFFLSWRVFLLPFIDHSDLWKKFNVNEPWDSPNNLPLLDEMPDIFRSFGDPADSTTTQLKVPRGNGAAYGSLRHDQDQSPKARDFLDGLRNTVMVIETGPDKAVPWTKPDEFEFNPEDVFAALGNLSNDEIRVLLADSSLLKLPADIDAETFKALLTRSGLASHRSSDDETRIFTPDTVTVDADTLRRKYSHLNPPISEADRVDQQRGLAEAFRNYSQDHSTLPVNDFSDYLDADGNPLLSWRVRLLPYFNQSELYDQFHLDEPWDSPHNLPLMQRMPDIFRDFDDPWDSTTTRIRELVSDSTEYPFHARGGKVPLSAVSGETILVVEAGEEKAVPWTKPGRLNHDPSDLVAALGEVGNFIRVALADGSVEQRSVDPSKPFFREDAKPPTVVMTSPTIDHGLIGRGNTAIEIDFSEQLVGANFPENFELLSSGADGILGNEDDWSIPLMATFHFGAFKTTLSFDALPEGLYRLTIRDVVSDMVGNRLDGDGDTLPGGNWVSDFVVNTQSPDVPDVLIPELNGGIWRLYSEFRDRYSVAIDGNLRVVGIPGYGGDSDNLGGIVDVYDATTGQQVVRLNSPQRNDYASSGSNRFGDAAAIWGNIVLVAEPNRGTIHFYDLTTRSLVDSIVLSTDDRTRIDDFEIADSEGRVVVSSGERTHVFDIRTRKLIASFDVGGDVAISGDTVVVGSSGRVDIFDMATPTREPQATFGTSTIFGHDLQPSVAISGNTIVVRSPDRYRVELDDAVFYLVDATTGELMTTVSENASVESYSVGEAIVASSDTIAVGAIGRTEDGERQPRVHLYDLPTGAFRQVLTIPDKTIPDNLFEYGDLTIKMAFSSDGSQLIVGVRNFPHRMTSSHTTYVFDVNTGSLVETILNALRPERILSDQAYAPYAATRAFWQQSSHSITENSDGKFHVRDRSDDSLLAIVSNPSPQRGNQFGANLAVGDNLIAVGAPSKKSGVSDAGRVYLFDIASGSLQLTLSSPTPTNEDNFGRSVRIVGNTIVVSGKASVSNAGRVYLFDAETGVLQFTLLNPIKSDDDQFGGDIAIMDNTILAGGSPLDHSRGQILNSLFVFDPTSGELLESYGGFLGNRDLQWDESLTVDRDISFIAKSLEDAVYVESGAVYIVDQTTDKILARYRNPTPARFDHFGDTIERQGNQLLVTATGDDTLGINRGAVYMYVYNLNKETLLKTPDGWSVNVDASTSGTGQLLPGVGSPFDGMGRLQIDGVDYAADSAESITTDDQGQTVLSPIVLIGGLNVSREVTVPQAGYHNVIRTLEVLHNPTGAEITTTVRIVGNLASDGATTVFTTSDGNHTIDPGDTWFATDDADGEGTPAIIHAFAGDGGFRPDRVDVLSDNVVWEYTLSIPAGETYRLMHLTVLDNDRDVAVEAIGNLVTPTGFDPQALAFLQREELETIVNQPVIASPDHLMLSSAIIAENQPPGTIVGTFDSEDPTFGDDFTYTLITGPGDSDNHRFVIDGENLKTTQVFDYEVISDYTVRVRTTDATGLFFEKVITIEVSDVDTYKLYVNEEPIEVSEAGSHETRSILLDAAPTTDVIVSLVSLDPTESTVQPETITFTPSNWNTPQSFVVQGTQDPLVDGTVASQIRIAVIEADSDSNFAGFAPIFLDVQTTDDDEAGFSIVATDESTVVTEGGEPDSISVVLTAAPLTNVVITAQVDDESEVSVSQTSLTFTTENWDTPQTVEVSGVDDVLVDSDQESHVSFAIQTSDSDAAFRNLASQTVVVTTLDDDRAGFSVIVSDESTVVSEGGGSDTISVVLTAAPLTDVVIAVEADDESEVFVSQATLTFTTENWDTPKTVEVSGVDDVLVDGDQHSQVSFGIHAIDSDLAFRELQAQAVAIATTDDDEAGFFVIVSDESTMVSEGSGTDFVSVVLTAAPLTDVVISARVHDPSEVSVSQTTLTFTTENWDTPQTVEVSGVDDVLVDGDQHSLVSFAIQTSDSDAAFNDLEAQTVAVTTTDDDTAGFLVTISDESTLVSESGDTDTISVFLTVAPLTDVVIAVEADDGSEVSVSQTTLTFTTENWDAPQLLEVSGVDDVLVDGDQESHVSFSIQTSDSDAAFGDLASQTVVVTTLDDDRAGFFVTVSDESTVVSEGGGSDTISVILTAAPLTDVVIAVEAVDESEVFVSQTTLTFTTENWDTPQLLEVSGVDDVLVDGDQESHVSFSIQTSDSDAAFGDLASQTVVVTTLDDDRAGFSVTVSDESTVVSEGGGSDTISVILTAAPLTDVVIAVEAVDESEVFVSQTTLTFTTENWDTPQLLEVSGVDDVLVDGDQESHVSFSIQTSDSDAAFGDLASQTVVVTTLDDDRAGFSVTVSDESTVVSEGGGSDTISVILTAAPLTDVVIAVEAVDESEVFVSQTTLTFTTENWDTPQLLEVSGVDDVLVDGDQESHVSFAIQTSDSDAAFGDLASQTVVVTTLDDDRAGFFVTVSDESTVVSESGDTDTISVFLTVAPLTDVVIAVEADDGSEVSVSQTTLTFTTENWDTPQTVEVSGVDDVLVDGDQESLVSFAIQTSDSDAAFNDLEAQTVAVTTTDDDTAGFLVTISDESTLVSESGDTDTISVFLTVAPLTDVVIAVEADDGSEVSVSQTTLTFTTENWDTPQSVEVSGVDDVLVDGDQQSLVSFAIQTSDSDAAFNDLEAQTVAVTTTDDDTADFLVTISDESTLVSESGDTDTISVFLTVAPLTDVVIAVEADDGSEVSVSQTTLTFTTENWDTPQSLEVSGVDDVLVDGDQESHVSFSIQTSDSDAAFGDLVSQTFAVLTTDDDTAGFSATISDESTVVSESEGSDSVLIVLTAAPLTDVVITAQVDDEGEVSVRQATLTFTTENWDAPQSVEFSGVDDVLVDGDQESHVSFSIQTGDSDSAFGNLEDQVVAVTTTDDDTAGFLVIISDESTVVSESEGSDSVLIVLTAAPLTDVVITAQVDDEGEVSVSQTTLTFTTEDWDTPQTVEVSGVDDELVDGDQESLVTVSIQTSDSDSAFGNLADQVVAVTTTDDDTAGLLVIISDESTVVSESEGSDFVSVVLTSAPLTDVVITAQVDDEGEVSVSQTSLTFTIENWDTPQTVEVSGVDDELVDGDQESLVSFAIQTSDSDAAFNDLADQVVAITTTDDDTAGFSVTVSDQSTVVSENGETDTVSVVLTAAPLTDVILTVAVDDPSEIAIDETTLWFTTDNWNTPQTVEVRGVPDLVVDPEETASIVLGVAEGSDTRFALLDGQSIDVSIVDHAFVNLELIERDGSFVLFDMDSGTVLLEEVLSDLDVFRLTLTSRDERLRISVLSGVGIPIEVDTAGGDDLIEIIDGGDFLLRGGQGDDEVVLMGANTRFPLNAINDGSLREFEVLSTWEHGYGVNPVSVSNLTRIFQDTSDVTVDIGADTLLFDGTWQIASPVIDSSGIYHRVSRDGFTVTVPSDTPWKNPINPADVNRSGTVTAIDALRIINRLVRGDGELPIPTEASQLDAYYDVNGDGRISALDALRVVNAISRNQSLAAEFEQTDGISVVATSVWGGARHRGRDGQLESHLDSQPIDPVKKNSVSPNDFTFPRETAEAADAYFSDLAGREASKADLDGSMGTEQLK